VPTYRLTLAYDGTAFCGWQKQEPPAPVAGQPLATGSAIHHADPSLPAPPGRVALRTVQAVTEHAVRQIVREPIILTGASRTDAGVHARGQTASFTCSDGADPARHGGGWPLERGLDRLARAINGRLPQDVLVTHIQPTHAGFNPIGDAERKAYTYTFHDHHQRPLFDRDFVTHTHHTLDAHAMHAAARHLIGEHDFAAFTQINHDRQSTVRTIYDLTVERTAEHRVRITVTGSGFLYNMVRIIAGTLHEVGRGKIAQSAPPAILASADRRQAGPTAGPSGLCLEWIRYPGDETDVFPPPSRD
jgi:tRNA pseudouridine38-40 synthase